MWTNEKDSPRDEDENNGQDEGYVRMTKAMSAV